MRVPFNRGVVALGALALLLAFRAAVEAGQPKTKPPPPPPKPPAKVQGGGNKGGNKAGANRQVPADQVEKLLNMSPEERQKALSKLPPPQQKQLQNRLDNLDRQSPAQRQQTLDRLRQLEKLPPARQQAVTRQIQGMNGTSIADQRQYLNSPEFAKQYSPEEQQIIRERFPAASSNVVRPTDKLVPARRQAVNQQAQRVQGMSFQERREYLHSPEFEQNFSSEEQQILRDRFPNAAK